MANIFARLINQYKLKYQRVFSAILDKQDEDDQVTNKIEFHINLKINQIITESEIDNIDIRSQLEPQIQNQETKDSGWKIDKINSMIFFLLNYWINWSNLYKISLKISSCLQHSKRG